jgi:hypothetical protein
MKLDDGQVVVARIAVKMALRNYRGSDDLDPLRSQQLKALLDTLNAVHVVAKKSRKRKSDAPSAA